jgi:hypothetical protein
LKGNGVNRQERKESPSFVFSKNHPLLSFAFLASFAVEVFASAVAVYSALRIPHSALRTASGQFPPLVAQYNGFMGKGTIEKERHGD